MKQMKIIFQKGYSTEERLAFREEIFFNCVEAIKQVVTALEVAETTFTSEETRVNLLK